MRRPDSAHALPVVVSIPHFGVQPLPDVGAGDWARPVCATFAYGYADAFAADLYGGLDDAGATVIASPVSRLFVDLNRRRDDFEIEDGAVRSVRGVARTHTVHGDPIFASPLSSGAVEDRLCAYYDPYHSALAALVAAVRRHHGHALLVDAHTGSERGMGEHEIVVGTRRGRTCDPALAARAVEIFEAHEFAVHTDVRGYAGGHIVRTYGDPAHGAVHAIQIEVNSSLLIEGTRREFIDRVSAGEVPAPNAEMLARLRACLATLLPALAGVLDASRSDRSGRRG